MCAKRPLRVLLAVAALLVGACGTGDDPLPVVSGPPSTSPPTSEPAVAVLSSAIAEQVERIEFERAVEYAVAVEEARIAAERAEAQRQAEEARRQREAQRAAPAPTPAPAPAPPAVAAGSPSANRDLGRSMAAEVGWVGEQWSCLDALWSHESGWKETAANPTSAAYGIPQANPGSKMASHGADWRHNPATQISWGIDYIAGRYTTPCGALSHSRRTAPPGKEFGWY